MRVLIGINQSLGELGLTLLDFGNKGLAVLFLIEGHFLGERLALGYADIQSVP